jgi:hypothetical protein
MVQKMPLCFTNIHAEIELHILGYSFFYQVPHFCTFLANVVAIKSVKKHLHKSYSALAPTMLARSALGASGRIQSMNLRIMSKLFCHCATRLE